MVKNTLEKKVAKMPELREIENDNGFLKYDYAQIHAVPLGRPTILYVDGKNYEVGGLGTRGIDVLAKTWKQYAKKGWPLNFIPNCANAFTYEGTHHLEEDKSHIFAVQFYRADFETVQSIKQARQTRSPDAILQDILKH